jgi:hypothetical protein
MWKWITSLFSSVTSGASMYIMIAVAVVSAGSTGYVTYKIEHANVMVLTAQNQKLLDDNLSTAATVTALRQERAKANTTCQKQIALQNKELQTCKDLLVMKGENKHETPNTVTSGDPVLDKLNGLYPQTSHEGYLCSSGSGTSTGASAGLGSGVLLRRYCFNSKQDAINWIMNKTEHDARESRMEVIIDSHQTPTSTP